MKNIWYHKISIAAPIYCCFPFPTNTLSVFAFGLYFTQWQWGKIGGKWKGGSAKWLNTNHLSTANLHWLPSDMALLIMSLSSENIRCHYVLYEYIIAAHGRHLVWFYWMKIGSGNSKLQPKMPGDNEWRIACKVPVTKLHVPQYLPCRLVGPCHYRIDVYHWWIHIR